tara:strand:- start:5976 stop:6239 length:264 start_codon:yes stop_codon:yes gene_type:complete
MHFVDKATEKVLREIIIIILIEDKRIFRYDVLYTTEELLPELWKHFPEDEHFKLGLVLTALGREEKVPFYKVGATTKNLSYFQYNAE